MARPGLVKKLGKVEREADDVFGKLISKVAVTFSTTCERDGLYKMLIDQYETRLDVGYRTVLRNSLTPDSDPIEALKLKTLADAIEKAASLIEDFSKTLSIVASKDT